MTEKKQEQPVVEVNPDPYQQSEAKVSANVVLRSEKGANIQVTVRHGATNEDVERVIDTLVYGILYSGEKYHLTAEYPEREATQAASTASVPPTIAGGAPPTAAPTPVPDIQGSAPGITSNTFRTEKLVKEIKSGKVYWKIMGPPYSVHGVTVWPEVLQDAGWDPEQMVEYEYSIPGYIAHFVLNNNGNPKKVTKLEKV